MIDEPIIDPTWEDSVPWCTHACESWHHGPLDHFCLIDGESNELCHPAIQETVNEKIRLQNIVDKLKEVLAKARSDIFQTARTNQMNIDGRELNAPGDAPCQSAIGNHYVHQLGVNESLAVVSLIENVLAEAARDKPNE